MTDREAMKMALEALEDSMYPQKKQFDAIVGLKQALAQPEQTKCPRCGEVNPAEIHTCSPQIAHSEQEPVAYMSIVKKDSAFDKFRFTQSDMYPTPVYTAPQSKEWVGLTSKELATIVVEHAGFPTKQAQAISDKLKEKNA